MSSRHDENRPDVGSFRRTPVRMGLFGWRTCLWSLRRLVSSSTLAVPADPHPPAPGAPAVAGDEEPTWEPCSGIAARWCPNCGNCGGDEPHPPHVFIDDDAVGGSFGWGVISGITRCFGLQAER